MLGAHLSIQRVVLFEICDIHTEIYKNIFTRKCIRDYCRGIIQRNSFLSSPTVTCCSQLCILHPEALIQEK